MGSASLKVNEPSMEEILASIRRIIADDQERAAREAGGESLAPDDVLDIADDVLAPRIERLEPVLGPWSRADAVDSWTTFESRLRRSPFRSSRAGGPRA